MTHMLPLTDLHFGHEAPGAGGINARATDRGADLAELKASIAVEGLIQALAVWRPEPAGPWYVVDGNRRLAALNELAIDGAIPSDAPIPVMLQPAATAGEALARSLAANILQVPLHPVDRYEAFARCEADGLSVEAIAARFGVKAKTVRQSLVLGRLSPKVREAWRANKIDSEAARAFTLAADPADQDRFFDKLTKARSLYAHAVRREISGGQDEREVRRTLTFVGRKAYEAAGGGVVQDLFGDGLIVTNQALLQDMAARRMNEEKERLIGEGWSWAATPDDLGERYWQATELEVSGVELTAAESARVAELQKKQAKGLTWDQRHKADLEEGEIRAAARLRAVTDEHRQKSGCLLDIDDDGRLEVSYALLRPYQAETSGKRPANGHDAGPAEPKKASGDLGWNHRNDLSIILTEAVRETVAFDPPLAMAAAIGALEGIMYSPVRLRTDAFGRRHPDIDDSFRGRFKAALQMSEKERLARLASLLAGTIDLRLALVEDKAVGVDPAAIADLTAACAGPALNDAIRRHFEPGEFFARAPAAVAIRALEEMGQPVAKAGKKADLAARAGRLAEEQGWLPGDLRTAHYAGPGAAKAKPARKRKAKAEEAAHA